MRQRELHREVATEGHTLQGISQLERHAAPHCIHNPQRRLHGATVGGRGAHRCDEDILEVTPDTG